MSLGLPVRQRVGAAVVYAAASALPPALADGLDVRGQMRDGSRPDDRA